MAGCLVCQCNIRVHNEREWLGAWCVNVTYVYIMRENGWVPGVLM